MFRPLMLCCCTLSLACAEEIVNLEKIEVQDHYPVLEARKEDSIAKRIIQGEELTQFGDLNALELLKRIPGVSVPDGKKKKSEPGKGYTKILIDGDEVPPGSKRRASPLEQISPDMIERIEVMTNGSAEYSAEAMGGIVNVILKKPKSMGLTTAKITGGYYGDVPMGTLFGQHEGKAERWSYLYNTTLSDNRKSDTYSIHTLSPSAYGDRYLEDKSRDRSFNLSGKAIYSPDERNKYTFDGTLALNDAHLDTLERRYLSGVYNGVLTRKDDSNGVMVWAKAKGEHHVSGNSLAEWKLKYHQNTDDGENTTVDSTTYRTQNDHTLFRIVGADGSYSIASADHWVKTGVELKRLDQYSRADTAQNGVLVSLQSATMHENKGAVFVQDEITLSENHTLTPGLRFEKDRREFTQSYDASYWAPSLHWLYRLGKEENLRACVAKTVRLPRLMELSPTINSSLGQNDLSHPDVVGNPDLHKETALGYELRYEHYFGDKGIASFGGFYRTISGKIEKMITLEGGRYVERPYNAGEGRIWGVEAEFKKTLEESLTGLTIYANATLQNSSLDANGVKRPFKETPDYVYNLGFDHTLSPYRLTYGAAYRYVGGYDDPVDENGLGGMQKGYGYLDVYMSKRLNPAFKAGLNLKNITSTPIASNMWQYDPNGAFVAFQGDRENSRPQILLTLEGKW